jgi:hypothetical protein
MADPILTDNPISCSTPLLTEATLNFQMQSTWKILWTCLLQIVHWLHWPHFLISVCFRNYSDGKFPSLFTLSGIFFGIMKKSDPMKQLFPDQYMQVTPSSFNRYEDGWVEKIFPFLDMLTINGATAASSSGEVSDSKVK